MPNSVARIFEPPTFGKQHGDCLTRNAPPSRSDRFPSSMSFYCQKSGEGAVNTMAEPEPRGDATGLASEREQPERLASMTLTDNASADDGLEPFVGACADSNASDSVEQVARDDKSSQFISCFARNQHAVHAYVRALVPNRTDADDIMQEVSLALWNKWHTFDPETNFVRWACAVAFIEILRYRRKMAKDRMWLNESLLEILTTDFCKNAERYTARLDALTSCLEKLHFEDRRLIDIRYREGGSVESLANESGRPQSTVYKMLLRIRESLRRCIDRTMAAQLHPNERPLS